MTCCNFALPHQKLELLPLRLYFFAFEPTARPLTPHTEQQARPPNRKRHAERLKLPHHSLPTQAQGKSKQGKLGCLKSGDAFPSPLLTKRTIAVLRGQILTEQSPYLPIFNTLWIFHFAHARKGGLEGKTPPGTAIFSMCPSSSS